jgi:aryl-alcohol dehydrogenase-like predicted oxidoreductase
MREGKIFRIASRDRIMREIGDSLRRLGTDHIDIYQVHWPDPGVPVEETAEAILTLFKRGTIRAIGVSRSQTWTGFAGSRRFMCFNRPTIFSNAV